MEMEILTETSSLPMPIGYRFRPTDEEIIVHYLRPKVFSFPLPATAIIHSDDDLFQHHPSTLPGDPTEKRYFFCKPSYSSSHVTSSNPAAGYWKPIVNNVGNTHKLILATECNRPIGFKKSFVFYQFSDDHRSPAVRTSWILHQFTLLYWLPVKIEEWMVCSIHMKSKNLRNQQLGQAAKRLKKSDSRKNQIQVEERSNVAVVEDDSSSGITFEDDLDDRKNEEESRVN